MVHLGSGLHLTQLSLLRLVWVWGTGVHGACVQGRLGTLKCPFH